MSNPLEGIGASTRFLIIAPEAFVAAVTPLADHKNLTGMASAVVSAESLTGYFAGADEPEKIKRGIQYAYENKGTNYVMLVGDAANFPVRFWFDWNLTVPGYTGGITPKYENGETIPCSPMGSYIQSDLYYSSLYHHTGTYPSLQAGSFDDWNQSGAGLYNQAWRDNTDPITPGVLNTTRNPDNVDGYPDLAVGRLPARNTVDITSYVDKVISYETRPTIQKLVCTFVADEAYGDLGDTTSMADVLNSPVEIDYYLIDNSGPPPAPFTNATAQQVGTQAGGSTWVSYLGHGSPNSWDGGFDSTAVEVTKEATGLPVVFACGCGTTLFMNNVPWQGAWTNPRYIDVNGVTRGPFMVNPSATPGSPGVVITDSSTNQKWGLDTPGCDPLPVPTPKPAPLNIANDCFAGPWLFDNSPGGAIAYIGDHCVAPDTYPARIENYLLTAYAEAVNPVLGDLYLSAQRQYWAGPDSHDAATSGLTDYHGIPRLYLGWMVFFGDPSLRVPSLTGRLAQRIGNFDEDMVTEILVSSSWGIAILKQQSATMTAVAAIPDGTRIGGWLLETGANTLGPIADYDGDGHDEILIRSGWGLAILKLVNGAFTQLAIAASGSEIGSWQLDTTQDVFGPVGDFDGDGQQEILVSGPAGVAILKLVNGTLTAIAQEANGSNLGGWMLETGQNRFGVAADVDGDGHAEIVVTSTWGLGILKLSGNILKTMVIQPNGTSFGGWKLETTANSIVAAGDFDGDDSDELLITSDWGLGILKLSGSTLAGLVVQPNGIRFGTWLLETGANQIGPVGDFDGDGRDEILITSPWGLGILKLDGTTLTTLVVEANGTRLGEWVLATPADRFGLTTADRSSGQADLIAASRWGLGILQLNGSTLESTVMQANGTRLGGSWLLETTENEL